MNSRLYFDYAAATPVTDEVKKAMRTVEDIFANPSARYTSAREAHEILQNAKKGIAQFLNCNKDELVMTSSTTESNNLALFGVARACEKGEIISITTEHPSVFAPLRQLEAEGFELKWCKVDTTGRVSIQDFTRLLSTSTKLVTINYASSEMGTLQPIAKLTRIVREFNTRNATSIVFHTDASAAATYLSCDVSRLGVDLLSIGASKLYGPKGIAVLYARRGTKIKPIIYGGGQQDGLRSSSENPISAVGFAKALDLTKARQKDDAQHYKQLYVHFLQGLEDIDGWQENGNTKNRLYNIVSISFSTIDGEALVSYLDAEGIEVATGAACNAGGEKPSRILLSLGKSYAQAQGSLRISFGRDTSHKDIDKLLSGLKTVINTLQ